MARAGVRVRFMIRRRGSFWVRVRARVGFILGLGLGLG